MLENYRIFKINNDVDVCIGGNMVIVLKNENVISGFFDKTNSFQSGDCINHAYLAESGDFIYCTYGDNCSTMIIKIDECSLKK